MQSAVPHRLFDRLALSIMVVIVAFPITYLEVAHPSRQQLSDTFTTLTGKFPLASPPATSPASHATASPSGVSSATSATATPAIVTAKPKTATTNSYVHLRASKSVNSAIITNIVSGITVQLRDDADPTWQGVTYQGKTGYIYRAYLQY